MQLKAHYELCFPAVVNRVFQWYTAHGLQLPFCPRRWADEVIYASDEVIYTQHDRQKGPS